MGESTIRKVDTRETVGILEAVLSATGALEAALFPLDVGGFEQALAARADALRQLGAVAARAPGAARDPTVATLVEEVAASDARVRGAASRAIQQLRDQIQELSAARRGLSGYRGPRLNVPRFADRRG